MTTNTHSAGVMRAVKRLQDEGYTPAAFINASTDCPIEIADIIAEETGVDELAALLQYVIEHDQLYAKTKEKIREALAKHKGE